MKAFHNFEISRVAVYVSEDIKRLTEDSGIVRSRAKILTKIYKAQGIKRIASDYASFKKWLDTLDKSNNFAKVVKQVVSRFKHVGKMTAYTFLYSVGEDMQHDETVYNKVLRKA